MRRSFLCPNVLRGCTHTMIVNRRGEIIGCADYAPNGLTMWQATERLETIRIAWEREYNLRDGAWFIENCRPLDMQHLATQAREEAEMWADLATWLNQSLA